MQISYLINDNTHKKELKTNKERASKLEALSFSIGFSFFINRQRIFEPALAFSQDSPLSQR